jgi:ribosomal protein S14
MLASDEHELLDRVSAVLAAGSDAALAAEDEEFLASRLAGLVGPLAADRIVDEWERMAPPSESGRVEQVARHAGQLSSTRRTLGLLRNALRPWAKAGPEPGSGKGPYAMEVEHKFPSLDVDALRADAARLAAHLGRFQDVEIVQIGDREVLLRAAGR